jgi:beta-glucanase (GH16 family)
MSDAEHAARRACALVAGLVLAVFTVALGGCGGDEATPSALSSQSYTLVWSDEFNGTVGTGVDTANWIYDLGTGYPGGPPNWGTGEVEVMTDDTANVYHDGQGHLAIRPLLDPDTLEWTSGRIETQRSDFAAPKGGVLAIEASIQQPDVSGGAAAGYWPAFWSLGAPFRGNYLNWPGIGEIDIMEDINGRSSVFGTLHCGTVAPPNPCNEFSGLGSGEIPCPNCQKSFHTYRAELDDSIEPAEIRWYLDATNYFTVKSSQVDATTWANATDHGFFLILNVSMGGGFPGAFGGGPTDQTVSGVPMLVDWVRVYVKK